MSSKTKVNANANANAKVKVSDIERVEEKPVGLSPEAMSKLQAMFYPIYCSFTVANIDNAIANGLRRTMLQELLVSHLTFDIGDDNFKCNDVFLLNDMIKKRFNLLPILQDISPDAVFELIVDNRTPTDITVYTTDLRIVKGAKKIPCNKIPLFTLATGCSVKIKNIRVEQKYAYEYGFGGCIAYNCASVPVDIKPIEQRAIADTYHEYYANIAEALKSGNISGLKHGLPSSVANPSVYKLSLRTNGNITPEEVVKQACEALIERLEYVSNVLPITEQGIYKLVIKGESDTIGNIILRTGLRLYPNAEITTNADTTTRSITITVKLETTGETSFQLFIKSIIENAVSKIQQINEQF
jgi:DNA-directed RNA polymerase alpha subunit